MKNLIENWQDGLVCLITDDLISFYTFFTVALAECAYLLGTYEFAVAIPMTIILLGYILNVIVFARLKGNAEGTKLEKVYAILYVIVFAVLLAMGCFFNWAISIINTVILLGVTELWIIIRNHQASFYSIPEGFPKIVYFINKLFLNDIFWILSQIVIIGGPFVMFVIFITKISFLPIGLKIIIPLIYLLVSPLIAYYEDDSATSNIFEIAYDIT